MSSLFYTHCCLSELCAKDGPKIRFISQVAPKTEGTRSGTSNVIRVAEHTTTDTHLVFESAHTPHAKWALLMQRACTRGLSVEDLLSVWPLSQDQAMCFGATESGFTCVYLFKIQDAQARSGFRQLCLSLTSPSREVVITNHLLLKEFFSSMARLLQSRAKQLLLRENSVPGWPAVFWTKLLNPQPCSDDLCCTRALRDLPTLLGEDVGLQLHQQFCQVLRAVEPAPVPVNVGWKEKLSCKVDLLLQSLKSPKPLTGWPPGIRMRLCQEDRETLDKHFVYSSATSSPCRMTPGPEHGGEGDLITDRLLAEMMFGTDVRPMKISPGDMKMYCIDQT